MPLLALAAAALLTAQPSMPKAVPAALLAFVLLFGVRSPDSIARRTLPGRPQDALVALALPRGGIVVSREDSTTYTQLVQTVQRHASGGWMYVWHDAPQIYFLAGLRNPTSTTFEAFEDSVARSAATLSGALRSHDVRVVVLTDPSGAARPMDPAFRAWLTAEYPESAQIDRFEVRWRRGPFNLKG
jgi:hypothetical protein